MATYFPKDSVNIPQRQPQPVRRGLTAGELAVALYALDPDTPVFVDGDESSVNYVTEIQDVTVALFANRKDYYGQHADNDSDAGHRVRDTHGVLLHGEHVPEPRRNDG